MCQAIRFSKNEFPEETLQKHHLQIIADELRIYYASSNAWLPILLHGENRLVKWGNTKNFKLPKTGFCKKESLEAGKWQWLNPVPIAILASSALVNGIWFQVRQGIQGVLLTSESGTQHGYIVTQPATHYFKTMTGAERMPVLINQIL